MASGSFGTRAELTVADTTFYIHRLDRIAGADRLPYSLKVLLENLLRNEDDRLVTAAQVSALAGWQPEAEHGREVAFTPARVHHRSHLPRRCDQGRLASRAVPVRARRLGPGLQLLRLAPRQPRSDDPGHVREHPAANLISSPGAEIPVGGYTRDFTEPDGRVMAHPPTRWGSPARRPSRSPASTPSTTRCRALRRCEPAPPSSTRPSASTRPARRTTTGMAASCSTSCASCSPADHRTSWPPPGGCSARPDPARGAAHG